MPTASRNERRKRRLKRNNSLLKRALQSSQKSQNISVAALFMVLAQKGGEVTLSKGTVESVTKDLAKLSYSIDKGAEGGEFVVRLVVQSEPVITDNSTMNDHSTDQGVVRGPALPTAVELMADLRHPDTSANPTLEETMAATVNRFAPPDAHLGHVGDE